MGHLRENGFEVEVKEVSSDELGVIKSGAGIRGKLTSCHTAFVEGYVIEGHVPADLVLRLLDESPDLAGLVVPGMPIGSPGMEGPNPQPHDVLALDRSGGTEVYDSR